MAANFWTSTQHQLIQEEEQEHGSNIDLSIHRRELDIISQEERKKLIVFFVDCIKELASETNLRQRVCATAIIFFQRFYKRRSFLDSEPSLMAGTTLYLASKVEEFPLQLNLLILKMTDHARCRLVHTYTRSDITTCEFYLLETLECKLVTFHPYRGLVAYAKDVEFSQADVEYAWQLLNDSYYTDLLLRHPPYKIALACILIAGIVKKIDQIESWFSRFTEAELQAIAQISTDIMEMYSIWSIKTFVSDMVELVKKLPRSVQNMYSIG